MKLSLFAHCMLALMALVLNACVSKEKPNEHSVNQKEESKGGQLFIIGGGDRTEGLMKSMLEAAGLQPGQYIGILPMSSEEPDSAFYYLEKDIRLVTTLPIVNLHFEERDLINKLKLDSVRNCKLLFISGGDQKRFMARVGRGPIYDAILEAYNKGGMIAGTSAGAAVMSEIMITGDENFAAEYESTYDKVWKGNGIYAQGMGFLKGVIVDQHFIVRSRYNRLLSALCDYPKHQGIGVDEETAVLVKGKMGKVVGESQVVVVDPMDTCSVQFHNLRMGGVKMNIYLPGDEFEIKSK